MNVNENLLAALKAAEARAQTESESWVPKKAGDGVTGKVVGIGQYVTAYGISPFAELEIPDGITVKQDGKILKGTLYRVGFMGEVMEKAWNTFAPTYGDYVSVQHLGTRPQKDGMNDYKLTQTVVLNEDGTPKLPVDLRTAIDHRNIVASAPVRSAEEVGLPDGVEGAAYDADTTGEADKPF